MKLVVEIMQRVISNEVTTRGIVYATWFKMCSDILWLFDNTKLSSWNFHKNPFEDEHNEKVQSQAQTQKKADCTVVSSVSAHPSDHIPCALSSTY